MSVRVEFYGIPRRRAGVASIDVEAHTLQDALAQVAAALPHLAESCFEGDRLRSGYLTNINGRTFTTDPTTRLAPGDAVLILSADAGG